MSLEDFFVLLTANRVLLAALPRNMNNRQTNPRCCFRLFYGKLNGTRGPKASSKSMSFWKPEISAAKFNGKKSHILNYFVHADIFQRTALIALCVVLICSHENMRQPAPPNAAPALSPFLKDLIRPNNMKFWAYFCWEASRFSVQVWLAWINLRELVCPHITPFLWCT